MTLAVVWEPLSGWREEPRRPEAFLPRRTNPLRRLKDLDGCGKRGDESGSGEYVTEARAQKLTAERMRDALPRHQHRAARKRAVDGDARDRRRPVPRVPEEFHADGLQRLTETASRAAGR